MKNFLLIPGIGPKLAETLIEEVGTPSSLDEAYELLLPIVDRLPTVTQQDIRYRPLRIIPRSLIQYITLFFPEDCIFAGSYRRCLPYSGDIDIVIPNDPRKLVLDESAEIVEPYSDGADRMSCLLHMKLLKLYVKIDFFITTKENLPYMLFHATGSKTFNIRMRKQAIKLGMKLNQYGLFTADGKRLPASSEQEIMSLLKLPYVPPDERTH